MANDIRRRPWLLDTASASPVKANSTFTTGFVFRDYTGGAGSLAVLKDDAGRTICKLPGDASGAPVSEAWYQFQAIQGLTLSQIDSGVVEVIVR